MSLPIVLIHHNDSEYLIYSLSQAKKWNPQSPIILLGDNNNSHYDFVEHYNTLNYSDEAKEFAKIYRHYSPNNFSYELFCFQRWLVLKNFMTASKLEKCLYIDSDVLLYTNVTEDQKKFAKFAFTLSAGTSPHCVYINSLNALDSLCNYMFAVYTDPLVVERMEVKFQERIQRNDPIGGISDMTIFWLFAQINSGNIGEITTIIDNSTYDHNINLSLEFEMRDGRKNIYFLGEQPFCKHLMLDKTIRFNAIHFQGSAKRYIKEYLTQGNSFKEGGMGKRKNYEVCLQAKEFREPNLSRISMESVRLDECYVILLLNLKDINLIIFPAWLGPEDFLVLEVSEVIRAIATHPDKSHMTLLIHIGNFPEEDANLLLSAVAMNLLMQDDGDVTSGLEISLVGQLEETHWEALVPRIQARIVLENENKGAIAVVKAENIPAFDLDSFNSNINLA